jgi:hypothetical protein
MAVSREKNGDHPPPVRVSIDADQRAERCRCTAKFVREADRAGGNGNGARIDAPCD